MSTTPFDLQNKMKPYRQLAQRIARDKARKAASKAAHRAQHDGIDNIITYKNWTHAIITSNRGSDFKRSVQVFDDHCILIMHRAIQTIKAGGFPDFATDRQCVIRERGKARQITPVTVDDRSMQHVMSDNAIMPTLSRYVIRQNCANQAGKGTHDARRLLERYLEQAKRQWPEIWVWTYDFQNFFGSIRHRECLRVLQSLFTDDRLVRLAMMIITSYQLARLRKNHRGADESALLSWDGVGICLGSQISQDMAITVPDPIDKLIKQAMPYCVRFADDGIVLWHSKTDLVNLQASVAEAAHAIGLTLHPRKTCIRKATQGFTFLKVRYHVQGKTTIKRLSRSSPNRMRHKLRKFRRLVDDGKMTLDDVWTSMQSWTAHTKGTRCKRTLYSIYLLYDQLFKRSNNELLQNTQP